MAQERAQAAQAAQAANAQKAAQAAAAREKVQQHPPAKPDEKKKTEEGRPQQ
jgi:hypothetical protein